MVSLHIAANREDSVDRMYVISKRRGVLRPGTRDAVEYHVVRRPIVQSPIAVPTCTTAISRAVRRGILSVIRRAAQAVNSSGFNVPRVSYEVAGYSPVL